MNAHKEEQNTSKESNKQKSPIINEVERKKTPHDFKFGPMIGEGSFSMVYLCKDIHNNKEYAIKVCEKRQIVKEKKQKAILREKRIMNLLTQSSSPFFVRLYYTFHDTDRLYFVMNYAKYGELLPYIVKVGSFSEDVQRFYTAEMLEALYHLHNLGIIHRDLKPENILLTEHMHILLTDFGSGKILNDPEEESDINEEEKRNSFVGTAQYLSPEMLTERNSTTSSDLWALGCILYQMVAGLPPFRAPTEYLIYQRIIKLEYDFPDGFHSPAKELVEKLLVLNSLERLGSQEVSEQYKSIKNHHFFEGINWTDLQKQIPPRILPYLPATSSSTEAFRSEYMVPDDLEPGLDDKTLTRFLGLAVQQEQPVRKISILNPARFEERLAQQAKESVWHRFAEGNLILRQGFVHKRVGLFSRKRMLLLTTGPHLYYIDAVNMVLKGQIPWSKELRTEPKNFKIFFVHTPKRTYYLDDPDGFALDWCRMVDEVRKDAYQC